MPSSNATPRTRGTSPRAALLITEAGGRCEDLDGGPLNLGIGVANVLGSNGAHPRRARRPDRQPPTTRPTSEHLRSAERTLPKATVMHRVTLGLKSDRTNYGRPTTKGGSYGRGRAGRSVPRAGIRVEAGTHRQPVAADEVRPVHEGRRGPLLVRRLPLATRASRRWASRSSPMPRGRRSSPPTSCRCHPPVGSCSGWADRSSTRARCPSRREWEIGYRAARIEKNMPRFLQNFDAIWDERKWELELGLGYFESYDFAGKSLAELGQYMRDARTFQSRAWEIHFEIMYPLLAIYLQLYGVCAENGIDPGNDRQDAAGPRLQDHGDRPGDVGPRRRGQAARHRRPTSSTSPKRSAPRSTAAGGNASIWLTQVRRLPGGSTAGAPRASPTSTSRRGSRTRRRRSDRSATSSAWTNATTSTSPLESLAPRARRGDRRRPLAAQRRRTRRVQRAAGDQQRRQLRVVERGAQLLHRPARLDPDAAGRAGHRRRRSEPTRTTTPLFLFFRELEEVCARRPSSGRTCSRSPPPVTSTTTTTRTCARRSRRSSERCPTRSKTRC